VQKPVVAPLCGHPLFRWIRVASSVAWCVAYLPAAVMAQVVPPPLPAGSSMVTIQGGMDTREAGRQTRAHHHKLHYGKDYMHDDTLDPPADARPAPAAQAGATLATTQVPATPARAIPAQAAQPCQIAPAGPPRIPTAGDLAAQQPRPGDLAALGAAGRPTTAVAPSSGCNTTTPRSAFTTSTRPDATTNSRITK
jgi:hypothetical protein